MNAIRKQGVLLLMVISLFVWVSTASADPIPVQNASFEVLAAGTQVACGTGCWWMMTPDVPGWTGVSFVGGQFLPGPIFNYVPEGNIVIWANTGYLEQTVGNVVPGVTYTLQVDVGKRNDSQLPYPNPQIMIGGTAYAATGAPWTLGDWKTWTAVYTGTSADAGLPITIRLESTAAQTGFDNVRFSDNLQHSATYPTPEPASLLLLATGLLGAALRKFVQ